MNVSLIWHIVKKDFRHTWIWMVAGFLSIAGWGVTNSMMMLTLPEIQPMWLKATTVFTVLFNFSVVLYMPMLLHAEALPGDRQYWLARPVNWKDLLAAKAASGFVVIFIPLALTLTVVLESQGFEIRFYLPQLLWKLTLLLGALLPLAALISVTKNFQQMVMWGVGLGGTAILVSVNSHGKQWISPDLLWIGDMGCTLLSFFLAAVIIVCQFAVRRTMAARVGLVGIVLLYFGGQSLFPNRFLFTAQQWFSKVPVDDRKARIELDENRKRAWDDPSSGATFSRVFLPLRLSGMGTTESATFDIWDGLEIFSNGERMSRLVYSSPWLTGIHDGYWFQLPVENGFYQRHSSDLTDIKVVGQMTLYGNKKSYFMTVSAGSIEIPGVCRCHLIGSLINCNAPFQIRQRLVVYLKDPAGAKQEQVIWLQSAERRPFSMNFNPLSSEYVRAYLPYKLEPNDQLEIEVSEAQSFVERSLELRGIRIADYAQ